ncbi:EH domain-containing and endocytosis protein 1-like isoform X1 [Vanessa atalanta]|uniref:EH domain-containing and endocytosis protein 1-like isoform X1 n=1 Tax=Vanessa atalanta TaxID=42275 RepID=UPI001FCE2456|nr:EH domain-containing and endocytosis protein 1-like isoform X1 [Vanessa atalanta]
MQFFIHCILFICVYVTLTNGRPSHFQEENDSEIGVEYEGDESADDEYVPEEGEAAADEESRNQELAQDADINKEDSERFSETESSIRKEGNKNNPQDSSYRGEADNFSIIKEHPNYMFGPKDVAETENSQPSHTDEQNNRVECRNVDERSTHLGSDYSGELLFKKVNEQFQKDNNGYKADDNDQSNMKKQYGDKRPIEKKDAKNYDYFIYSDRNRRQVQSFEEKPVTDLKSIKNENNDLNVANENTILKNIKKLSDQDLENLMNSLPEDKKALLRKIMDKREITKKAGAIEDNNYLDQSDTSKIEGSYSVSSLSSNSLTTETNKHVDNSEGLNTKISDTESETGKLGSKSEEKGETSTTEDLLENTDSALKEEGNINCNTKETIKSDNKREINREDITNKNIPFDDSLVLDTKNSNDSPIDKESSEDEDWLEPKSEEFNAEQREVSQSDPSDISASVEKLEDSFPNANAYGDIESSLEPLVRIKRKELHHKVKKRDLPYMTNDNLSFITDFETEESGNDERSELNQKESFFGQSDFVKKNVGGKNQNVMNNKKKRNKRSLSSNGIINSVNNTLNLSRSSRTTGPLFHENSSMSDNRIDKAERQIDEAFGSFTGNSEEDVNRYKRVKK